MNGSFNRRGTPVGISMMVSLCWPLGGCTLEYSKPLDPAIPYTWVIGPPEIEDDRSLWLFDGSSWELWRQRDGSPSRWELGADGSITVANGVPQTNAGDAISAQEFGDFQLHLEFLCPIPWAGAEGQAKSNSGVYIHGRYEIQVLDSFGEPPADNLCGGIYKLAAPLVNASKPAGSWQSYDVIFRAPRFDAQQKVTEPPRITVIHNGVVIHNNVILPGTTAGGLDREMVPRGPILLQDHGDPVRYRNIWVRRLE
jgi:hypothetical protein